MYCPNCGKQNPDDAKFCESCGAPTGVAEAPKAAPPPPPPPPPQQPVYNQPTVQQYAPPQQTYYPPQPINSSLNTPISVGECFGTILLFMFVPVVNSILFIIWSFSSDVNASKKNLSKALLIYQLVFFALGVIIFLIFGGIIANLFNELSYY